MAYSVVGIFINIVKNKENKRFDQFIKRFSNLSDLQMEPFFNLYERITNLSLEGENLKSSFERFKEVLEFIQSNCAKRRDRTMSVNN
jgi:hypothetical protein